MATTPEAKVKAKIKKILEENNVYYAMPIGTGYGRSGVPDFLCCVDGKFLAIEAKATDKDKPTALQERELQHIRNAEGETLVVHAGNVDTLPGILAVTRRLQK